MIYEMRVYDIAPGKMAANEKRFEEANVPALFEKHGMKVVGFWTTMIGEERREPAGLHPGIREPGAPPGVLELVEDRHDVAD